MLQKKYCACREKIERRHTNSCNCHAKWSLRSNISVTANLQPFHGFCVGAFKHGHHKARNPCACHAKRIVSDPLQIHHARQRFCNPHELLRLPRILQRVEIPAPATRKPLWTSKTSRAPGVFTILTSKSISRAGVVQIVRSSTSKSVPNMQRGAFFSVKIAVCQFLTILTSESLSRAGMVQILRSSTSKSTPTPPVFNNFDFQIAPARWRGANFIDILGSRSFATPAFRTYLCEPSKPRNYGKNTAFRAIPTRQNLSCLTSVL